jgi:hypothetical protein
MQGKMGIETRNIIRDSKNTTSLKFYSMGLATECSSVL